MYSTFRLFNQTKELKNIIKVKDFYSSYLKLLLLFIYLFIYFATVRIQIRLINIK